MSAPGRAFADAASGLVGTPFRLRGRDPANGLDCIGLVACALGQIGYPLPSIPHYELRCLTPGPLFALLRETGFRAADNGLHRGDLVLSRPSPGQFHLAIATQPGTVVHAHAGIGRVVQAPVVALAPLAGHWRLP